MGGIKNRLKKSLTFRIFVYLLVTILIVQLITVISTWLFIYYYDHKRNEVHYINIFSLIFEKLHLLNNHGRLVADKFHSLFESMNPPGEKAIKPDFEVCDRFTAITKGSVATIFRREGDDFLRIATSLKKEDGSRAVGTFLGKTHPGYAYLMRGEPYVGKATLFGKEYMTKYTPIKNEKGEVVGSLFIGYDITHEIVEILKYIKELKIGEGGYVAVYDLSKDTPKLMTEREVNKSILDNILTQVRNSSSQDSSVKKISGDGFMTYYKYFPDFKWLITLNVPKSEFSKFSNILGIMLFISGIISILLIGFLVYKLLNSSLAPVVQTSRAIEDLAKGGADLNFQLPVKTEDEVGILSRNFNEFMSTLKKIVMNLIDRINNLSYEAEIINNMVNSLVQRSDGFKRNSEDIAQSSSEVLKSLEDIMKSLQEITLAISEISKRTQDSSRMVKETVNSVNNTLTKVEFLKTASKEIDEIVNLINNIADQTNLLALNASIEAARAGEAGKGFAVVATEVKELARQTQEATQKVVDKIRLLQESSEEVFIGVGSILDYVRSVEEISASIASAVEEQNIVINEFTSYMLSVKDKTTFSQQQANNIFTESIELYNIVKDLEGVYNKVMKITHEIKEVMGHFRT